MHPGGKTQPFVGGKASIAFMVVFERRYKL
jgi:hypothetical protein